jgi:hypothetical protein
MLQFGLPMRSGGALQTTNCKSVFLEFLESLESLESLELS